MDIKILVATHKKYKMPKENIYIPIHVGSEGKQDLGYVGDNTGDNISKKNPNYCELTGLYWASKNLKCDYIGLCHYRRYFTNKSFLSRIDNSKDKFQMILTKSEIEELLKDSDVILPRKRNYYIETIKSHYRHAHYIEDLNKVEEIIKEKHSDYLESFNVVMKGTRLHLFNMFIMKKEHFDEYSDWLFSILFELEKRVDISKYDAYQSRIFGFLSERLFNVWLEKKALKEKEVPVVNLEKVDWIKKANEFLKRKYRS
ncbi:DUF4422 domain-containing protein [Clostridium sp.]|uniref:DUF4422 domain-containing protein n=1 Tax=Clostridium sp. TaxID=1506 RepID=UPI002FCB331D